MDQMVNLKLRSQEISYDENGCRYWKPLENDMSYDPSELAIVIMDMWDDHWAKGAALRCAKLAPKIDKVVRRAREAGVFIVHGPSDTIDFYKDSPARKRALDIDVIAPDVEVDIPDYPMPVDGSDGGSDTNDEHPVHTPLWTRQDKNIFIDESKDIISDEGDIVYSHFKKRGIKRIIYLGVHTNMCILHRSFAIKPMLRRGMECVLVRDLTDALYNPARPPYVNQAEGTQLVVGFIEKFYCPTIDSTNI